MTTIKVISDLHINVKNSKEEDFCLNDEKFIKYINATLEQCSYILIVGDLFETWESLKWQDHVTKFRKIVASRPTLIDILTIYMEKEEIIYINGNHDAIVRLEELMPDVSFTFIDKIENITIVAEHGHKADIFSRKINTIGKFLTWVAGWLERLGWIDLDRNFRRMGYYLAGRNTSKETYHKYAKKLKRKYDADIVIFGHTHRPEITKIKDKDTSFSYINTGKCCDKRDEFDETTITITDGTYDIIQKTIKL